jgi:anti-anti-sigma factor
LSAHERVEVSRTPETATEPPFNLRWEGIQEVAVLVIEGEVDLVTVPAVRTELDSIKQTTGVVIDLCETSFMDSSGLRLMLEATRQLDGQVHIACVPGSAVRRLFDVVLGTPTGALKLFADRDEALAAFST